MPPRRGRSNNGTGGRTEEPPPTITLNAEQLASLVAQQVANVVPTLMAQINNNAGGGTLGNNDEASNPPGSANCTYKTFMGCKPPVFKGTEGAVEALHWLDEIEAVLDISKCAELDKVRFVSHQLKADALVWWGTIILAKGRREAVEMPWDEFKQLITAKYCPINELEKLQAEFLALQMVGKDVVTYTRRFDALSRLVPELVTTEAQKVARYIWGLDARVRGLVKAARPATLQSAVELAAIVTDDRMRSGEFDKDDEKGKKKVNETGKRQTVCEETRNVKQKVREVQNEQRGKAYQGTAPACNRCKWHHHGECKAMVCSRCKRIGHLERDCRMPDGRVCYECGGADHFRNTCPKLKGNAE